jgi:hypothetical protein
LEEFSEKNPNIHIHTKSILSLNDVRENQTEMMLAFAPPESRSDLAVERLGSVHYRPLRSRPVRIAFDWFCDIFNERNEWFPREFHSDHMPSSFEALTRLFD